jgi:hypothetical protein
MNLELKHLAPYLPHSLKGIFKISDVMDASQYRKDEEREKELHEDNLKFFMLYCKPILRPISDLSTRYGEDVINEHSINMLLGKNNNYGEITVSQWKDNFDIEIELGYDAPSTKSIDFKIMMTIMEELYLGHFDVFGLIPAGLAIDINTISPTL